MVTPDAARGRIDWLAVTDHLPASEPLTAAEVGTRMAELDGGWRTDGERLVREFRFGSFAAAFGLATRIAMAAERHDHHPDLEVGWGRLIVSFTSHDIGGLSERDFAMAARVDRLVASGTGIKEA